VRAGGLADASVSVLSDYTVSVSGDVELVNESAVGGGGGGSGAALDWSAMQSPIFTFGAPLGLFAVALLVCRRGGGGGGAGRHAEPAARRPPMLHKFD
jgi:hypothetical protein